MWRDLAYQLLDRAILYVSSLSGMEHVPSNMAVCHDCKKLVQVVHPVWVGQNVLHACDECAVGRTPAQKNDQGEWLVEYTFPGEVAAMCGPWSPGASDGRLSVDGVTWGDQLHRVRRSTAAASRWQLRPEPAADDEGCIPLGPWEFNGACWQRPLGEPPSGRNHEMPAEVFCNLCGKSCHSCGLIRAMARGHFLSPVQPEMCTYCFSLCESCLAELFDRFKDPPVGVCGTNNASAPTWRAHG